MFQLIVSESIHNHAVDSGMPPRILIMEVIGRSDDRVDDLKSGLRRLELGQAWNLSELAGLNST
jgi:hypothetical protein